METRSIEEGKRLIAVYMGLTEGWWIAGEKKEKQFTDEDGGTNPSPLFSSRVYYMKNLLFDSSFDWIMPVWNKIMLWCKKNFKGSELVFKIDQDGIEIEIDKGQIYFATGYALGKNEKLQPENLFHVVDDFLQWYNKLDQKSKI